MYPKCFNQAPRYYLIIMAFTLLNLIPHWVSAQCVASKGTVEGVVYNDSNNDGLRNVTENGISDVLIQAYRSDGSLIGTTKSGSSGSYSFSNLADGDRVRLTFSDGSSYSSSYMGIDNGSSVQFAQVPSCSVSYGMVSANDFCNSKSEIITTCFVQGATTARPTEPTIVGIEYGFNSSTPARKFAMHGETGSIWGLAWKNKSKEIFSSAFVKQYSGLKDGHDAIFKTVFNGTMYTTQTFVKLSNLGQNVGTLSVTDVANCSYGAQVGKIGLGAIVLSPDEKYLYVVNIYNNTLVRIETTNPTAANTRSYNIPGAGSFAFALKYYQDKIYVGTTVPGDIASVYAFDPSSGNFTDTGLEIEAGADWAAAAAVGGPPAFWLTDLDFADNGDMLISLSDRMGHTYCNNSTNRLDEQKGDLMIAYKTGSSWTLEDRSNGKEFFYNDYWVTNPVYHSEVTTGSIFALPGTGSVVTSVFDPELNSYSGGLHRYNTTNGEKEGTKELYTRETVNLFGKATGFGDIVAVCGLPSIEIGNLVWDDQNNNGLQDANESGLTGIKLNLFDENCNLIGSTVTNSKGNYTFNDTNVSGGINQSSTYYIGIDNQHLDAETHSYTIGGLFYNLTKSTADFTNIDSDPNVSGTMPCNGALIKVNVYHTLHNFDIGLRVAGECSLKIFKSVVNAKAIKKDDIVVFEISVANRGGNVISEIEVSDKLPAGYLFVPEMNTGWTLNQGVLKTTLKQRLTPGNKVSTVLSLTLDKNVKNIQFTNEAAIVSAKDGNGVNIQDIKSCLDTPEDGIDSDFPPVCDLALVHKVDVDRIYTPDTDVKLTTTVCNQGTLEASSYQITNYLNPEFDFDPVQNPGWTISADLKYLTYDEVKVLAPNTCRDYNINLTILDDVQVSQIINYSEISQGSCTDTATNYDFDSTPDNKDNNDKGGQPNTATDNNMDDKGDVDEDDHDPAVIKLDLIDLSLNKSIASRRALAGDIIVFNLTVKNEGNVPVSRYTLTDYIPANTDLADPSWTASANGTAQKTITVNGNLQPGQSYVTQCSLKIHNNVKHPAVIYNTAEIKEMYDQFNRNISNFDIDSTPDDNRENDVVDNQKDLKEDDISTTYVVLGCPAEYEPCSNCRAATTPTNGQFELALKIASKAGENWYVESSVGLYDFSSPFPPAAPVVLPDGFQLTEILHEHDGASYYLLEAIHLDGKGFSVRLRNEYGDLEQVVAAPTTCSFDEIKVDGPRSLCLGGSATYKASSAVGGKSFTWTVDGAVVGGTSSVLDFDWTGYALGIHEVKVAGTPGCVAPAVIKVSIGQPDNASIACIGNFNVSLDNDCEIVVTPSMMVAGTLNPLSPYTVMLTDAHGHPISDATLTSVHAGTKVMAKLIEGCGGNSCWSTITVEDKMAPVSICQDIELPCYKLSEYKGPFEGDNCDGPVSNVIVSETITPLTCNNNYVKYIDRVYQATDKFGNKSAFCNMRISLERPDMTLVKFPPSYMMIKDSALVCDEYAKDADGHPSISVTGVPTLAGISLYPSFADICNLYTGYKDEDLGYVGCTRKIIRNWTVYEQWCTEGQIRTFRQVLEITDIEPPVIAALPNVTVSTNGHSNCVGDVVLPVATVTDECSNYLEVDVTYPGGFIDNHKVPAKITLPAGNHLITYTAYDGCQNSSQVSFTVKVEDKTAPTVICKGQVVVGLNSNGQAYLYPRNIDDGSFDGCGMGSMKVAKMVPGGLIPDSLFKDAIDFGCADVGRSVMVALRVWDVNGNSNSCMVSVTIQDKHAPKIVCPDDLTIDCSEVFTGMTFTQYGTATAIDACGATVTESAPKFVLNSCRVGYIERTFTATDGVGTATCKQIITVENEDDFNPLTQIVKPLDYEVNDKCSADQLRPESLPAQYGYPVITQSTCGLAAASYKDEVYTFVTGACYKIVRKWTVIDWCEMDRLGADYVPYTFSQILKVNNTVPPFFVGNIPANVTFFTAKGNCVEGPVSLEVRGGDVCTPDNKLRSSYKIDFYNDGLQIISNTSLGHIATINMNFPVGLHKVQWSFEDQCGNVATKDQLILVQNNDKPQASCLESISVSINPWDTNGDGKADIEKACIKAYTLNSSSSSLCCTTPLKYSFSADVNDTIRCFDCFDVGLDNVVELWVHDCNGNTDFCIVHVDVQDNNNSDVCQRICEEHSPTANITGNNVICNGKSTTLTATGGGTYLWSNSETTAVISVSPTTTTVYTVTVTNEFRCTATASRTVTVNANPVVTVAGANVCIGTATTISATGGGTYLWNTGATTSSFNVNPVATTTYTVTVTNANGCTATGSKQIVVYPLPTVSISGDNIICVNENTTLTATGGSTYLWNTGATTTAITVSPAATTTYTVTATDINGCRASATRTVTVNGNTINVAITGNNVICNGSSTSLTASGGIAYIWSNNATTTSISVSPATTTTYIVTATDINGCNGTATRTVTVNPLPTVNISGNNTICIGNSTTLTAGGASTYVWNTGASTAAITVSPVANTTYTVTATDANGCINTSTRTVTVNPLPVLSVTGTNVLCAGQSTSLSVSGASTYVWSTGATTTTISVTPSATSTYTVTGTNSNGCVNTSTRTVTVNPLPNAAITGDLMICLGSQQH
jgi:uncharacterized repeat protein (TIGR01451 family)